MSGLESDESVAIRVASDNASEPTPVPKPGGPGLPTCSAVTGGSKLRPRLPRLSCDSGSEPEDGVDEAGGSLLG